MINDIEKEQLRHGVLGVVVARHPNALTRKAVLNAVAMDVDFDLQLSDVVSALDFLRGLGHVEMLADDFGGSDYWKATSSGVLANERSQRPGKPRRD